MSGIRSKLYGGTGVGVCHSSPRESHGFAGARLGSRKIDHTKFAMKNRNDEPSTNALTEEKAFNPWRRAAYSKTRLGIPSNPTMKSGKNVKLKKTNINQKWICPSRLLSVYPVIFGSQ